MTLDNLVGNTLERINPDPEGIRRLLEAAERNLADARVEAISQENRFDAAYKAIMQLANLALQANGFRTLSSRPGHHMTMLQSLPRTIGLERDRMIVLDTLRKQRNVSDYAGDPVSERAVHESIAAAEALHKDVLTWLRNSHPEWI
ncbi:MAG: DNA-binding protein [Gammaproteobacteria bacterium HGW-Gammaproteobacteria-8]|nr:MAG: DNA-binding protein [Gammaproteobacteria bacterium HGW-Gammaproteobacteria-8]